MLRSITQVLGSGAAHASPYTSATGVPKTWPVYLTRIP